MKKWLLLAVVGLMSACSKSDIEEVNIAIGAESPIFYASLEGSDETRTYLDENAYMRWTADDRVTIFFGENYNREFAFTGKTGATSGGFKQVSTDDPFYTAVTMSANYALYPYATDVVLEPAGYLEFSLPATQSYAEDSFGLNANTMVAVTKTVDDRFLQFKNVCGYLKLNLYGANVTVKSITLTGNNEEPLAGATTVTPTYGGDPSMAWAASGTTTSLTLDCGDGVKIGATEAEATPFWLVVPPTTFTKGFTVTITDTAGNTFTKSSTSKQTITRNISKNMPAFEVKTTPTGPANNEIWYTSTDGNIVEPYAKDAFGVAIKSNTYENGKGVITFGGDVKMIGEDAFRERRGLKSITLPEGLTSIGEYAFSVCTSLASITLPEGVTSIGTKTFYGCTSLKRVDISDIAAWCKISFADYPSNPMYNGASLYLNGTLVEDLIIPDEITEIKQYAFYGCTSLKSITLPEGLTTIGSSVFLRCTSLKRVDISDIAAWCKISFDRSTSNPLYGGASLYLNGTLVEDLIIPDEITEIKQCAFHQCTSLQSITIPEGVTSIGERAFSGCTSLASITLPEGLTTIGDSTFSGCTSLASITLPKGVTTIGSSAFSRCTSLASITLPEGVTEIGNSAFAYCTSLAKFEGPLATSDQRCIVIDGALEAFAPAELFEYVIPEGVTEIGEDAFRACTSLASITLPKGVKTIGSDTFYGCTSLKSITLPEGLTTIGSSAFEGCTSLASITLPEGLTRIGYGAFENCSSLASITLPEDVTTIGAYAFNNCTSLKSVYCKPTIPPKGGWDMFSGNATDRKIYVPAGSVDTYKAAEYWSDYASAIVAEE